MYWRLEARTIRRCGDLWPLHTLERWLMDDDGLLIGYPTTRFSINNQPSRISTAPIDTESSASLCGDLRRSLA
jgi:hypothetical protein